MVTRGAICLSTAGRVWLEVGGNGAGGHCVRMCMKSGVEERERVFRRRGDGEESSASVESWLVLQGRWRLARARGERGAGENVLDVLGTFEDAEDAHKHKLVLMRCAYAGPLCLYALLCTNCTPVTASPRVMPAPVASRCALLLAPSLSFAAPQSLLHWPPDPSPLARHSASSDKPAPAAIFTTLQNSIP